MPSRRNNNAAASAAIAPVENNSPEATGALNLHDTMMGTTGSTPVSPTAQVAGPVINVTQGAFKPLNTPMNAEKIESLGAHLNALEQTGAKMPTLDRFLSQDAQDKMEILIGVDEQRGLMEPDLQATEWKIWEPRKFISFLLRHFLRMTGGKDKSLLSMARAASAPLYPYEEDAEEVYKVLTTLNRKVRDEDVSSPDEEVAVGELLRKMAKEWASPNQTFKNAITKG